MDIKEKIVRKYFQSWINKDNQISAQVFSKDATYSECYGPIYRNKKEILSWFNDWNKNGDVLIWKIKRIIEKDNTVIAEWHFKCNYKEKISEFDGVSLIDFNADNQIYSVKEFQSKSEHYFPQEA